MDWELIFWIVCGVLALAFGIAIALPWNEHYGKKDPYKYCPKEREEY